MIKFAISILIFIVQISESRGDPIFPYSIKPQVADHLKPGLNFQLKEFNDLMQKQTSSGKEPVLGGVVADAGCSVSITKSNGELLDVYYDGVMNLDGESVKFRELTEEHNEFERTSGANHSFFKAPRYLLDIEITSFRSSESGENHNVVIRVSGPNGILVRKGIQHCGC